MKKPSSSCLQKKKGTAANKNNCPVKEGGGNSLDLWKLFQEMKGVNEHGRGGWIRTSVL